MMMQNQNVDEVNKNFLFVLLLHHLLRIEMFHIIHFYQLLRNEMVNKY
jgi:hypothetical protein